MPIDPGVQELIDGVKAAGLPAIGSVSAQQLREAYRAMTPKLPPGPEVHKVDDLGIPGPAGLIPARVYWPTPGPKAVIVYFHGGGWTIGSLDAWDAALRRLALATGCSVLSVDYRLAPEAPFPAAVEDALLAVHWAGKELDRIAGRRVPLIVAGDSAGGNLAAVVAQQMRDLGGPAIAGQVLIYPSTDGDIDAPLLQRFVSPFLTREEIVWFFDQYIPDMAQRVDPRFAPLRAKSLAKLPPAYVLTAENDLLAEEAELYAQRMKDAGVTVEVKRYLGTIHGFFTMDRGLLPHSEEAMADIAVFVRSLL
jgi:acetyl esterase